jgi:hypothetical protein
MAWIQIPWCCDGSRWPHFKTVKNTTQAEGRSPWAPLDHS